MVQDEKEEAPKEEQTKFTVKLLKFDDGAKIKLIKEIKGIIEGVNLVQVSSHTSVVWIFFMMYFLALI